MNESLTTKDQTLKLFEAWGVPEQPLPRNGQQVIVAFPPTYQFRKATVTVAERKSTYGKTLYRTVLS